MESPSIFHAIFNMNGQQERLYENEWYRRYPGKQKHFEEHIEPYTYPAYMLFSAPVTTQLLSFFKVITDINNLDKVSALKLDANYKCPECDLVVTSLVKGKCLKCLSLDLDD